MTDAVITSVVNTPSANIATKAYVDAHIADTSTHGVSGAVVGTTDTQTLTNKKFGGETDYTEFEADGTMAAHGAATCFRDEMNDLIKGATNNPSSKLVFTYTEGTLDFADDAGLNDFAITNVQINHDWELGSDIEPHIHWFQNEDVTPNWLVAYRWQKQTGAAKTTDWTYLPWSENAYAYTSGTINQITSFGTITPPEGYGEVSDIVQFKIIRDTANDSEVFDGVDTYTGDAEAVSFDVHIEVDMMGSRERYSKDVTE